MTVGLTTGLLAECYCKIRENLLTNVSVDDHVSTYIGEHGETYAEPEFTGKYIDICMQYVKMEGVSSPFFGFAKKVIGSVLANQRPDGDLSCLENGKGWFSVWNQTFTVLGMISYYDVTNDKTVLLSAEKCANRIINQYSGVDLPSILDSVNDGSEHLPFILPLVQLFERTGKTKYLSFLKRLFEYLETTDMNLLSFEDILKLRSRKGIEMLIIFSGVAEFGRVTGDIRYSEAAARYWKQVNQFQIRNTGNGTIDEKWCENGSAPANIPTEAKPNETCVAVGFLELALKLFDCFGEAVYLDAIEKALFNHILGAMDAGGRDFAYYQGNYGVKIFRKAGGLYQCCRYRGYSLFSHLPEMLYRRSGNVITPIIYASSRLECEDLSLTQTTTYPGNGTVDFDVRSEFPMKLKLRIPVWCKAYRVYLNGNQIDTDADNGFVLLPISVGANLVRLELDTDIVTEYGDIDGEKYAAFSRGALLLAEDSCQCNGMTSFNGGVFTELHAQEKCIFAVSCGKLVLTDYASAGRKHPGTDTFRVWVPVEND